MKKLNFDVNLEGISSGYVEGPFDDGVMAIGRHAIISLEENALLRILEGEEAFVSKEGNYTREGFVYVPSKGVFLVRKSPIIDHAEEATLAHREGREFYINDKQVEKALENSVQLSYDIISIPTNRFNNEEITTYAFGEQAEDYGEFLRDAGINEMPIWFVTRDYIERENKAFVRQLWFAGLGFSGLGFCGSDLVGNNWALHQYTRLRGIQKGWSVSEKPKPKKKLIYINPFEVEYKD